MRFERAGGRPALNRFARSGIQLSLLSVLASCGIFKERRSFYDTGRPADSRIPKLGCVQAGGGHFGRIRISSRFRETFVYICFRAHSNSICLDSSAPRVASGRRSRRRWRRGNPSSRAGRLGEFFRSSEPCRAQGLAPARAHGHPHVP